MIALSEMDRERFGVVTAREPHFTAGDLEGILRFCRERAVQMLIARCAAEDLHAAQAMEAAGGRLMDALVYWVRRLDVPSPQDEPCARVRMLRAGDAEAVRRIAQFAFRGYFGHYHADPRLDRAKCDEVYASWAHRSCIDPSAASTVLVAEHEGRVAGFLTLLERSPEEQEIILNAVDPSAQRHGLYRSLLLAALAHARRSGASRLSVSTQLTNVAVQRSWSRAGFELDRSYYTFHLWFEATSRSSVP